MILPSTHGRTLPTLERPIHITPQKTNTDLAPMNVIVAGAGEKPHTKSRTNEYNSCGFGPIHITPQKNPHRSRTNEYNSCGCGEKAQIDPATKNIIAATARKKTHINFAPMNIIAAGRHFPVVKTKTQNKRWLFPPMALTAARRFPRIASLSTPRGKDPREQEGKKRHLEA